MQDVRYYKILLGTCFVMIHFLFVTNACADSKKDYTKTKDLDARKSSLDRNEYPTIIKSKLTYREDAVFFEVRTKELITIKANVYQLINSNEWVVSIKPLIFYGEDNIVGNGDLLNSVGVVGDRMVDQSSEDQKGYVVVKNFRFSFNRPVTYTIARGRGFMEVKFAEEIISEDVDDNNFLVRSLPLNDDDQVTGQSTFGRTSTRELFEREGFSRGEVELLDQLGRRESRLRKVSTARQLASEVFSENAVRRDFEMSHPRFGTSEYWNKYVSGVFTATSSYTSSYNGGSGLLSRTGDENKDDALIFEPAFAIQYRRPGVVQWNVGYSVKHTTPYYHELEPNEGSLNQTVRWNAIHFPEKPYIFKWNNSLTLSSSHDLSMENVLDSEVTETRSRGYSTSLGVDYLLKRDGVISFGGGVNISTNKAPSRNRSSDGFLALGWDQRINNRLKVFSSANYSWVIDGASSDIRNVHSYGLGFDYKLSNKSRITPGFVFTFVNDSFNEGYGFNVNYQNKLSKKLDLSLYYANEIISIPRASLSNTSFGGVGLTSSRTEIFTAGLGYKLSPRMRSGISVNFLESESGTGLSNTQFETFRFNAFLLRQISEKWAWELRYVFEDFTISAEENLDVTSSQNHAAFMRLIRYIGEGV